MVVLFLIIQIDKSKIILSQVYTQEFNDNKTTIRDIYIRDKIIEEYLFLKSIENDQTKVAINQLPSDLVIEHFNEKFHIDNTIKYEGVLTIDKPDLFESQKNVYWKYHLGYCIALVCEDYENIQMASNFISILQLFITKENLTKLEVLSNIIDSLLPSGQLMFMTIELANCLMQKNK